MVTGYPVAGPALNWPRPCERFSFICFLGASLEDFLRAVVIALSPIVLSAPGSLAYLEEN